MALSRMAITLMVVNNHDGQQVAPGGIVVPDQIGGGVYSIAAQAWSMNWSKENFAMGQTSFSFCVQFK